MARLDRDDWVRAAVHRLTSDGIEAVAVEAIAADLGVTKGSFYWHFDRRRALLDAMLEDWERQGTLAIIDRVEAASDDPAERLRALGRLTIAADTPADAIEPALRAWAVADPRAAAVVRRVDERRLAFTRDLLVAAGVGLAAAAGRAEVLYRVLIGEWVYRGSGGAPLAADALEDLLGALLATSRI